MGTSLGDQLLAEVASKHRHRSADDVGDAFQEACSRALTRCPWRHQRHVYGWLRRAMENLLSDQDRRERQEVVADTGGPAFERFADDRDEPPVELARREDRADLKRFQRSVGKLLSDRQRRVWALHINGTERRQVARVLGASERAVKKDLERIYSVSREQVISRSGHGCPEGERLMVRLAFGLASASERVDANRHFIGCESCGCFYRRMVEWQEKVAVLLPLPAAQADPALVERGLHTSVDALASLKHQVGNAGSQVKQQLADAAAQAKQHAAAGYTRTVEYTPLASVRPGAAATAIAGCLALGGGAAGYCIDKGVDPITGLADVVQPSPAKPAQEPPEQKKPPSEQPPDPPQVATPAPTPAQPEPQPTPPAPAPEQPATAPAPAPAQPAPPPEAPPEPTPPAIQFGEPASPPAGASTPQSSPAQQEPAPVPESGGTDLYGP